MDNVSEVSVPVAEAPTAPAPTPSVSSEAASTPAVTQADAAASSSEAPVEESSSQAPVEESSSEAPAVTHDTFNWDSWEGGVDSFPDDIRPWASRISDYHTNRFDSLQKTHKNLKDLYDAVLVGGEDPRIKQYESDRAAWEAERAQFETQRQELQSGWDQDKQRHQSYEQAVYQYHVQQAEKELEAFVNARPEILKDEAKYELFSGLLDEKWDLESAGKLLSMPADAVAVARKARAEGVPASYAIQFAERQAPPQVQKPQPRPAATITSGAVNRTTPHSVGRGMGDAKSLEESRAMASAKALKIHKR